MQRGRPRDGHPTKDKQVLQCLCTCREVSKCSVSVSLAHEGLEGTFRAFRGWHFFPSQCPNMREGEMGDWPEPLAGSLLPSHTAHLPWSQSWRGGQEGVSQWAWHLVIPLARPAQSLEPPESGMQLAPHSSCGP